MRVFNIVACALLLAGCAAPTDNARAEFTVAASTPLLADIVGNVAGEDARVVSLMPQGADPHSFEPSLRTVRDAAHAKLLFANGYLLEPQALMDTMREVGAGPVVEVADEAATRGARVIPLVEDVALDAVWLGLRSLSDEPTEFTLDAVDGPGVATAYVVNAFGAPEVLFQKPGDSTTLPAKAHTHVSWAFSEAGTYTLTINGHVFRIVVGVPPQGEAVSEGHVDITEKGLMDKEILSTTTVAVPSSTLQQVPGDPAFRFLGHPGDEVYLLPQAVLGKHIHGEIDPHLWHDVDNVKVYADVIAEKLATADPGNGHRYRERAAAYQERLGALDTHLDDVHLVTTHHGFAYLKGTETAGFVTPQQGVEPSPRDVIALKATLKNMDVGAVFVGPQEESGTATLREAAREAGVAVCTLYGDTLDEKVPTYEALMRHNVAEIRTCVKGKQ